MSTNRELSTQTVDEELKRRAAYALNMCTVSVAQIVDYNDEYVLEQEYDAILNNLNLEQMPKDEALLTILSELMNVITFFRIQEIRKEQIEKKYQRRLSNAIWSAVPNIGLIVAGGNPITLAISLASQVGIGYMNYRKEKADAAFDNENEKVELEITAIEQFNAIKRELFTTAWRLADTYQFPDHYRLTEKQIKQYNAILMDTDEVRKYERLETIQNNFEAYPPFWYFFGHTANYIAGCKDLDLEDETRAKYRRLARCHFEKYLELNELSILREDRIAASCCLEYAEMLLADGENPAKISDLLKEAIKKSGYDNDVLQIAALNYIHIGQLEEAGKILKILVNEDFNQLTNARLLSRIYVSRYLKTHDDSISADYDILSTRIDSCYLFPFPKGIEEDEQLQAIYMAEQKSILQSEYRYAISEYIKRCGIRANRLLTLPPENGQNDDYYSDAPEAVKKRDTDMQKALTRKNNESILGTLSKENFRREYIDLLNEMLRGLNTLGVFSSDEEGRVNLLRLLKTNIYPKTKKLAEYQNNLDEKKFTFQDYKDCKAALDFDAVTGDFAAKLKNNAKEKIDAVEKFDDVDTLEFELVEFCQKQKIALTPAIAMNPSAIMKEKSYKDDGYLRYSVIGRNVDIHAESRMKELAELAKKMAQNIVTGPDAAFYVCESDAFKSYFKNSKLSNSDVKEDTFAILDDKTKKDLDILLTDKGYIIVKNNVVQAPRNYNRISYSTYKNKATLQLGWPEVLNNQSVDIAKFYDLIEEIEEVLFQKQNGGK